MFKQILVIVNIIDCNIEAHSDEFEQDTREAAAAIAQVECIAYVTNEANTEATITNWIFNNAKVPKQAISNILHEMNLFYPSITITVNTLLALSFFYCGRYCNISDSIESKSSSNSNLR